MEDLIENLRELEYLIREGLYLNEMTRKEILTICEQIILNIE